jgi:hypothetical protein
MILKKEDEASLGKKEIKDGNKSFLNALEDSHQNSFQLHYWLLVKSHIEYAVYNHQIWI